MRRTSISSLAAAFLLAPLSAAALAGQPGAVPEGAPTAEPTARPEGVIMPEPVPPASTMSDWPCVQRRVEALTVGQFWDGPPVEDVKELLRDRDVGALANMLASRRVPLDKTEAALKSFAEKSPEGERDRRLTAVFAALFDTVNNQRKTVVKGIGRYQKAQIERSAELEREGTTLGELEAKVPPGTADEDVPRELADAREKYKWATRIFQERQQSIPIACELPGVIEERLAAVVRQIRGLMKS